MSDECISDDERRLRGFARSLLYRLTGHRNQLLFSMREESVLVPKLLEFFGVGSVEELIVLEEVWYRTGVGGDPFGRSIQPAREA